MTSTFANSHHIDTRHSLHHQQPPYSSDLDIYPTPQSVHHPSWPSTPLDINITTAAIADATAILLQQYSQPRHSQSSATSCMTDFNPRIEFFSATPASTQTPFTPQIHTDSGSIFGELDGAGRWTVQEDYDQYGMGGSLQTLPTSLQQQQEQRSQGVRSHQRTPSASTVASNGPSSPFTYGFGHPQIANTDFAPASPNPYGADQSTNAAAAFFSKHPNLPTPSYTQARFNFGIPSPGYMPSQASHTPTAHQAMKTFAIDHHNADDFAPAFAHTSGQSMSSHGGADSPTTPRSGTGENAQNDYPTRLNPNVQLFRTESQAYQDELYNPPTTYTSVPTSAAKSTSSGPSLLTPHRNLVNERLQSANNARSNSPVSAMSRERSPFRDGSPLAPVGGWSSPRSRVGTAASIRQHQKEQADQTELAQHRPPLQREPTKTISPRDAVLEYNDAEQPSLFQDSIPEGYKPHNGAAETWTGNDFASQASALYGNNAGTGSQSFADAYPAANVMNFASSLPANGPTPVPTTSYMGYPLQTPAKTDPNHVDATPQFPAHLTSMESSVSDNGPPASSQDSGGNNGLAPRRPSDTRAATGTYTCTYHGCTQRFDTPANLQKHKRDFHRSQQPHQQRQLSPPRQVHQPSQEPEMDEASSHAGSTSPRSTDEDDESTSGLTSAALLARNSQAGPHKCSRINPSTGKPCNTIFSRPYDLTRHEDTIHNNRKHKVRCPLCREEKTFSRNDALTRHMRVVHPEVESYGKRGRRDD